MGILWVVILSMMRMSHGYISRSPSQYIRTEMYQQKSDDLILRQIDQWACVKDCGACCKLGPIDSRPDLADYLTPTELKLYESMIGPDNWCVHFDKKERKCTQYATRPSFCQVNPESYKKMFGIEDEDFSDFCNFCCREQITDVYGAESAEMSRFNLVALDFEEESDDNDDGSYDDEDDDK